MTPRADRIRVLVADDSLVAREMLRHILGSDPRVEIVGLATDGVEAVELTAALRPDLVTMDIHMPRMDGIEATERIMAFTPTPVLVVSSSVHGDGVGRAFDALASGALDVVGKPEPRAWHDLDRIAQDLIRRVRLLAGVRVITHVRGRRTGGRHRATMTAPAVARRIVAVGASTGGPTALRTVLGGLAGDFPVPVVVVQHIADGFVPGLVEWLDAACTISVREAAAGAALEAGCAYVAPTGTDLGVRSGAIELAEPAAGQVHAPSVDVLFAGVAREYGAAAAGVLLTGMGADGARGLRQLRDAGAATIAQDEATSAVFGMPRSAIELDAVERVLSLNEIAAAITESVAG